MSFTLQRPYTDTTNDMTPINDMAVIVPSDTVDLPGGTARALLISGSGTVTIDTPMGNTVTFTVGGTQTFMLYIRARRVRATGTTVTAGLLVACY